MPVRLFQQKSSRGSSQTGARQHQHEQRAHRAPYCPKSRHSFPYQYEPLLHRLVAESQQRELRKLNSRKHFGLQCVPDRKLGRYGSVKACQIRIRPMPSHKGLPRATPCPPVVDDLDFPSAPMPFRWVSQWIGGPSPDGRHSAYLEGIVDDNFWFLETKVHPVPPL
jgi:hypothetical protein